MSVCCECCVLSGRGLCDELITRPEKSYRLWCVVVCDLETSKWGSHGPRCAAAPQKRKEKKRKRRVNDNCVLWKLITTIIMEFLI